MEDSVELQGNYAGIDFGISNIDVITMVDGEINTWKQPSANEPSAALVGELLAACNIELSSLDQLAVTGGRHRLLPDAIDNTPVVSVGELAAISRGGQAMAGLNRETLSTALLIVSAGSGTAMMAACSHDYQHVTGSGVGGGTMLGLARLLLGTTSPVKIDQLALNGDANNVDLSLSDVVMGPIGSLPPDTTAVNFGRLAHHDLTPRREDLAAAIVTLVGQVVGTLAINAARAQQIEQVVFTGHLTDMMSMRANIERVGDFFGLPLTVLPDAGHATALGALLYAVEAREDSPSTGVT